MARRAKIQHIGIVGKQWWRRSSGGTYFSSRILVNGDHVATVTGSGGGSMYEQAAVQWLVRHGVLPEIERQGGSDYKPLWQHARDLGFKYNSESIDVPRERDLDEGSGSSE
jgi:hypothetical protein